jgi:hypothetical protein
MVAVLTASYPADAGYFKKNLPGRNESILQEGFYNYIEAISSFAAIHIYYPR